MKTDRRISIKDYRRRISLSLAVVSNPAAQHLQAKAR